MEAAWDYHPIPPPTEIAALYRICGKELTNHLGIKLSMSTAYHPQADDQQDDWVELFPLAEHAYNTAVSETTKTSPFFANYGYQPETQWIRPAALEARDCYRALPGVTNLEGDEDVDALIKEFHRKYPQSVRDRRVSLD
jgi:hypothetical protein